MAPPKTEENSLHLISLKAEQSTLQELHFGRFTEEEAIVRLAGLYKYYSGSNIEFTDKAAASKAKQVIKNFKAGSKSTSYKGDDQYLIDPDTGWAATQRVATRSSPIKKDLESYPTDIVTTPTDIVTTTDDGPPDVPGVEYYPTDVTPTDGSLIQRTNISIDDDSIGLDLEGYPTDGVVDFQSPTIFTDIEDEDLLAKGFDPSNTWDRFVVRWTLRPGMTQQERDEFNSKRSGDKVENPFYNPLGGHSDMPQRNPYTAYLNQLGLLEPGFEGYNPADLYATSLYDPIERLYGLQGRFAETEGPGDVIPYMTSRAEGFKDSPGTIYSGAGDILRRLIGMGRQARRDLGFSFSPEYPAVTGGEPVKSAVTQEDQMNLMRMALRPRMGYSASRRISERLPEEMRIWQRQQAAGEMPDTTDTPFLSWLATKYGIGNAASLAAPY
jgi:hypothetical protein